MSATIRCIYTQEPGFPATDQHPSAVRYQVGAVWVDAIGGEPTEADVAALLVPDWRAAMLAELRAKRDALLNVIDGIQGDALASGDTTAALKCKDAKAALKALPDAVQGAATAQEFRALALTAFKAAATQAQTPALLVAFATYLK